MTDQPRNRAKCLECDEVIESTYRHDFQQCSGGHIFVDGGHDYMRVGAYPDARYIFPYDEDVDSDSAGE
jgi:hypothetical protein